MLDLTDLLYFRTIAREGGVTRASEKLHRVQSNVTTRLRKLEDQLGTALFLREGKRMILTADGHRLIDYADRLLALAEETEHALRSTSPGGPLRLGAMESTAAVRLPPVLDRLLSDHPEIIPELSTGTPTALADKVLTGDLDAALAANPPENDRLDSVAVYTEQVVIISVSPSLGKSGPVMVLEKGCPHRAQLEAWSAATSYDITRTV